MDINWAPIRTESTLGLQGQINLLLAVVDVIGQCTLGLPMLLLVFCLDRDPQLARRGR